MGQKDRAKHWIEKSGFDSVLIQNSAIKSCKFSYGHNQAIFHFIIFSHFIRFSHFIIFSQEKGFCFDL